MSYIELVSKASRSRYPGLLPRGCAASAGRCCSWMSGTVSPCHCSAATQAFHPDSSPKSRDIPEVAERIKRIKANQTL